MKRHKRQYGLISTHLPRLVMLLVAGLLLSVAGCGRAGYLDEKERSNRILAKAYEMVDLADYETAASLFREVLDTYPTMARPHLDLALVLHDREKDYLRAVYHYNRYLELRPGTEKDDMIRARMQQAERAFVASRVTVNGADGPSAMELLEQNSRMRARLKALETTLAAQEKELLALREAERRRLREQVISGGAPAATETEPVVAADGPRQETQTVDRAVLEPTAAVEPAEPAGPAIPEMTETRPVVPETVPETPRSPELPAVSDADPAASDPVDEPAIQRTYTVQRGDTLSRIALKVYGDATRWHGIQEANSDVLGNSVNVRVGQVLRIP